MTGLTRLFVILVYLFFIFLQTGIAEEVSVHSKVGEIWLDNDNASIVRR